MMATLYPNNCLLLFTVTLRSTWSFDNMTVRRYCPYGLLKPLASTYRLRPSNANTSSYSPSSNKQLCYPNAILFLSIQKFRIPVNFSLCIFFSSNDKQLLPLQRAIDNGARDFYTLDGISDPSTLIRVANTI